MLIINIIIIILILIIYCFGRSTPIIGENFHQDVNSHSSKCHQKKFNIFNHLEMSNKRFSKTFLFFHQIKHNTKFKTNSCQKNTIADNFRIGGGVIWTAWISFTLMAHLPPKRKCSNSLFSCIALTLFWQFTFNASAIG